MKVHAADGMVQTNARTRVLGNHWHFIPFFHLAIYLKRRYFRAETSRQTSADDGYGASEGVVVAVVMGACGVVGRMGRGLN
jgi:hypothetical protein